MILPHDTPEVVERLIRVVAGQLGEEYAAMISRLHARAVAAEKQNATARADALREAAAAIRAKIVAQSREAQRWRDARNPTAASVAAARAKTLKTALPAILSLIPAQEAQTHD